MGPAPRCPLRPIDHRGVYRAARRRFYTALATSVASPSGAVNTRPTAVVVYIALADGRRAVAKFSSPEFGTKFQRKLPLFLKIGLPNFPYLILDLSSSRIQMDALGHTLTPFCSVCRQFFGFIPGDVRVLQISSDDVLEQ